MKFLFHNDTTFNNIDLYVSDTRMCLGRGEGEEEIANHGWSRVKSFSQETGAIGQQAPRIGEDEPKLHSQSQVQDAHDSPTQLPFFSSSLVTEKFLVRRGSESFSATSSLRTVLAIVCSLLAPLNSFFSFLSATALLSFRCGTCAEVAEKLSEPLVLLKFASSDVETGSLASLAFGSFFMSGMMKMGPKFMGRPVDPKTPEQKLRDVSDMYEKHFCGR